MAGGGWRVAGGGWRVAGGGWRVTCDSEKKSLSIYLQISLSTFSINAFFLIFIIFLFFFS